MTPAHLFVCTSSEGHLSNDAGWVLLQNYREKGIVYHLVVLADKYQKSACLGLACVHSIAVTAVKSTPLRPPRSVEGGKS